MNKVIGLKRSGKNRLTFLELNKHQEMFSTLMNNADLP